MIDRTYEDIMKEIIETPDDHIKENRTGVDTKAVFGESFIHSNMEEKGFPMVTTCRKSIKMIAVELEGFIKGNTSKKWFQDRGLPIWDDWCNPEALVKYDLNKKDDSNSDYYKRLSKSVYLCLSKLNNINGVVSKKLQSKVDDVCKYFPVEFNGIYSITIDKDEMLKDEAIPEAQKAVKILAQHLEDDLGPIYGYQWRNFNGTDQLAEMVDMLKKNPADRRMLVSAWNPGDKPKMALPPCHILFQIGCTLTDYSVLNMSWFQRSIDTPLGLPYNIASYALLLTLLAKESGKKVGRLKGDLGDTHIYMDQIELAKEQVSREPFPFPKIEIPDFTNIFDWTHEQIELIDYKYHPHIEYPIAI